MKVSFLFHCLLNESYLTDGTQAMQWCVPVLGCLRASSLKVFTFTFRMMQVIWRVTAVLYYLHSKIDLVIHAR